MRTCPQIRLSPSLRDRAGRVSGQVPYRTSRGERRALLGWKCLSELGARVDVELGKDFAEVVLDGVLADEETGADLGVRESIDADDDIIFVFATKGGAPTNPDWYYNLTAAGEGSIERGTEAYEVTVRELTGGERDRIYAEQARRYPGFADYDRQTAGIRTIPVLELTRAWATSALIVIWGRAVAPRVDAP